MKSTHVNNNHWNTLASIRHHMYEYLLVFSCDQITETIIMSFKEYFERQYGCQQAAKLRPHLTLFNCVINESKIDPIIQACTKIARHTKPMKMELDGFDNFEHGTMYIGVEKKVSRQILTLVAALKARTGEHVRRWSPGENKFCATPHITIAKSMTDEQMENAKREWKPRKFNTTTYVNEITLLRRSLLKGSRYEVVQRFPLLGLPEDPYIQGSLFPDTP